MPHSPHLSVYELRTEAMATIGCSKAAQIWALAVLRKAARTERNTRVARRGEGGLRMCLDSGVATVDDELRPGDV